MQKRTIYLYTSDILVYNPRYAIGPQKYKYNKLTIQPKMQPKPPNQTTQKRKHSASIRRSIPQTPTNQQFQISINNQYHQQYDPKEYRLLLHCFSNSINVHYGKRHKDILGELEDLYKIPINKEEKIVLEEDMEGVVSRNVGKLVRDGLARNLLVAKNVSQYCESYARYQRTELLIPTPNLQAMKTLDLAQYNSTQPTPKQYQSQAQTKPRPQTSIRSSHPQKNTEKTNILNLNLNISANKNTQASIFRSRNTKQLMQYGYAYSSINTAENEQGECFVYIRENYRKGVSINQGGNKLKFHGRYHRHSTGFGLLDQLGIQDVKSGYYKVSDENKMSQNEIANNYESQKYQGYSSQKSKIQQKSMPKTNINRFFNLSTNQNQNNTLSLGINSHWNSKQKSRDQLQRQKIQNKILSMNGVLSANVVKSQGYKPKSRCWGHQIVSTGKINCNSETGGSNTKQGIGGKLLFSMIRYK